MKDTIRLCGYDEDGVLDDQTPVTGLGWTLAESVLWPWFATTEHQEDGVLSDLPPEVWETLDEEEDSFNSTPDGDYILYRNGERIAEAIRSVGFRCDRNDQLITDALGPYR